MHKRSDWATYQYPLYEHVIVLLSKLRSTEHKSAQQLYSRLSHTCGVVHQTTMDATLHVGLKNGQGSVSTKTGKNGLQDNLHSQQNKKVYFNSARIWQEQKSGQLTSCIGCEIIVHFRHEKLSLQAEMLTYPCQYAGVHSHNLRQTFHGFCPYSNGTFPKDSQDLFKKKKKKNYVYTSPWLHKLLTTQVIYWYWFNNYFL